MNISALPSLLCEGSVVLWEPPLDSPAMERAPRQRRGVVVDADPSFAGHVVAAFQADAWRDASLEFLPRTDLSLDLDCPASIDRLRRWVCGRLSMQPVCGAIFHTIDRGNRAVWQLSTLNYTHVFAESEALLDDYKIRETPMMRKRTAIPALAGIFETQQALVVIAHSLEPACPPSK